jgi:hypothetical protein
MLEGEQTKAIALRREIAALQGSAESLSVLNTLVDLPGVSAQNLMEIMSGKIITSQNDVNTAKTIAAQAQSEANKMRRNLAAVPSLQTQGASRSRSESPSMYSRSHISREGEVDDKSTDSNPEARPSYKSLLSGSFVSGKRAGERTRRGQPEDEKGAINLSSLSLVVDGETTPQVLLDSLNAATMAQSMRSQESLIESLRAQLEDAHEGILHVEEDRLRDADELEARNRIEIDSAHRRLELLQSSLEGTKEELAKVKERSGELEQEIVNGQTSRFEGVHSGPVGMPTNFAFSLTQMATSAIDTSTCTAEVSATLIEEDRAETEHTKNLLKERTAQLKILMETLDSLQQTGVKTQVEGRRSSGGGHDYPGEEGGLFSLAGLAATPLSQGSPEAPWGLQSLVKRVVELTAQLTSQSAAAGMEERRSSQVEKETHRRAREINKLKSLIKTDEETRVTMQLNLSSLGDQVREGEKRRADETTSLRLEVERLVVGLREAESEGAAQQVTIDELSRQIQLSEQVDLLQWLEGVISRDADTCSAYVDAATSSGNRGQSLHLGRTGNEVVKRDTRRNYREAGAELETSKGVGNLVMSLLTRWSDQMGPTSFIKSPLSLSNTPLENKSLSKAEQRFYQQVSDLVMSANQRSNRAMQEARSAETLLLKAELTLKVNQDRLRVTVKNLQRYRKRAYAFEQVARVDRKHVGKQEQNLIFLLNRSLNEQRARVTVISNTLYSERKDRQIGEANRTAETLQLRRLQLKTAELEARGGANLRGREEALLALEDRIKLVHDSMQQWFKVELPRLISGLPLPEESMANFSHSAQTYPSSSYSARGQGGGGGYGYSEGKERENNMAVSETSMGVSNLLISDRLSSSMGLDRSYAIAQSLCVSKAAQAAQDIRITGLLEKNYILKERNIEMEGVLTRWKQDIEASVTDMTTAEGTSLGSRSTGIIAPSYGSMQTRKDEEKGLSSLQLMEKNQQLFSTVQELQKTAAHFEEKNIEVQARLDRAQSQVQEVNSLVDLLTSEEDSLKGEATRQLTKLRIKLESSHNRELRKLREFSDEEKRVLQVCICLKQLFLSPSRHHFKPSVSDMLYHLYQYDRPLSSVYVMLNRFHSNITLPLTP